MKFLFYLLFLCVSLGCSTTKQLKEYPMYGHISKNVNTLNVDSIINSIPMRKDESRSFKSKELSSTAFAYFGSDDYEKAINLFNMSWILDTTNAVSYWGFAYILEKQEKYIDALPYFYKAMTLNKDQGNRINIYIGYAICLSYIAKFEKDPIKKENLFNESEKVFIQLKNENVNSSDFLRGWAQKYKNQGLDDKANEYRFKSEMQKIYE